jgi:hypothetical protein
MTIGPANERSSRPSEQMTDLESALDRLIADRSPRCIALRLSNDERKMLLLAQRIRGMLLVPPGSSFTVQLHGSLFPAGEGPTLGL